MLHSIGLYSLCDFRRSASSSTRRVKVSEKYPHKYGLGKAVQAGLRIENECREYTNISRTDQYLTCDHVHTRYCYKEYSYVRVCQECEIV